MSRSGTYLRPWYYMVHNSRIRTDTSLIPVYITCLSVLNDKVDSINQFSCAAGKGAIGVAWTCNDSTNMIFWCCLSLLSCKLYLVSALILIVKVLKIGDHSIFYILMPIKHDLHEMVLSYGIYSIKNNDKISTGTSTVLLRSSSRRATRVIHTGMSSRQLLFSFEIHINWNPLPFWVI